MRSNFLTDLIQPPRIRLAVVGATSSGKSCQLDDSIRSFRVLGYSPYVSERLRDEDGFDYQKFSTYSPDQSGGGGRTPVYACRQENHYGQRMSGDGLKEFDLDFLNIPGEIFTEDKLRVYNSVRRELKAAGNAFVVRTYVNPAQKKCKIVEPIKEYSAIEDSDRASTTSKRDKMNFARWNGIFGRLNKSRYQCESEEPLSGAKLLEQFFAFDTDSVVCSIADMFGDKENGAVFQISIKAEDGEDRMMERDDFFEHANAFVFFHYCSMATDIVVCDRVFAAKDDDFNEITFDDLITQLADFLDTVKRSKRVNVYLALRNVDFLLKKPEVERAYQELKTQLQVGNGENWDIVWRNALYSVFAYAMLVHLGMITYDKDKDKRDKELLGLGDNVQLPDQCDEFINKFLDLAGSLDHVHEGNDVKSHISARIGGAGGGFRALLQKCGKVQHANAVVDVPHVHFTCTPITEDFEVFQNGEPINGENNPNFYREGQTMTFKAMSSHACFGSLQLCLDILKQHKLSRVAFNGRLLNNICGIY